MKRGLSIEVDDDNEGMRRSQRGEKIHPQSTKHGKQPPLQKKLSERDYISNDPKRKRSDDLASLDGIVDERDEKETPDRKKNLERRLYITLDGSNDKSIFSSETPNYFNDLRHAGGAKPAIAPVEPEVPAQLQSNLNNPDDVRSVTQLDAFSQSKKEGLDQIPFEGKVLFNKPASKQSGDSMVISEAIKNEKLLALPVFKTQRQQPNPSEIDLNTLKFPETRKFLEGEYAKVKAFLQSPAAIAAMAKSSLYIDMEFRPCPYSILDDIKDPELKIERRMEWRRAMFIGKPKKPEVWFSRQPDAPISFQSRCAMSSTVCILVELLANRGSLASFYAGGDMMHGQHQLALYDEEGKRQLVTVDDQLPVVVSQNIAAPAFLAPVMVGDSYYILPSLLEKALAKLFGSYLLLHKAPPASVMQALLGSQVYVFRLIGTENEQKMIQQIDEFVPQGSETITILSKIVSPSSEGKPAPPAQTCLATKANDGSRTFIINDKKYKTEDLSREYGLVTIGVLNPSGTPGGARSVQAFRLSENQGGVEFVIGADTGKISATFKVALTKSDNCSSASTHIEVISLGLNQKFCVVENGADLGAIDLTGLEPDRYYMIAKLSDYDMMVEFSSSTPLEAKLLNDADLCKIKRAVIRRFDYKQEVEMLEEVQVLSEIKDSSVMFKVSNITRKKGPEIRFAGFGNWKHWMIDINGANLRLPLPRNSYGLKGQEEEYVRLYTTSPLCQLDKVRLVIN